MSSSGLTDEHGEAPSSEPSRARPRARFIAVGLVLAALLGVYLFYLQRAHGSPEGTVQAVIGKPAPSFTVKKLDGHTTISVPRFDRGEGAIVLFFASWCIPCQSEIPAIESVLHDQESAANPLRKTHVIGIAVNDPNVASFAKSTAITFPIGLDPNFSVSNGTYSFLGLPDAVLIRRDGVLAAVHYGALSTTQFVKWERRLAK